MRRQEKNSSQSVDRQGYAGVCICMKQKIRLTAGTEPAREAQVQTRFRLQGKAAPMKIMEFINAHREDEDYCECLIHPDGEVDEPLPSHIGRLIEIAGEDSATLNGQMEKSMEHLFWMVEYTGCMSVWQTRVVAPARPTKIQEDVLEMLHDAAFLAPKYLYEKPDAAYVYSVEKARIAIAEKKKQKAEQAAVRDNDSAGFPIQKD